MAFQAVEKPSKNLERYRLLAPTASVRVSPLVRQVYMNSRRPIGLTFHSVLVR